MGKGDPKSKKGKIFKGSFGNLRPRKVNENKAPVATAAVDAPKKTTKK